MPELPEVQAVVDGLRHVLPGRRIVSVHVRRADVCRPSGAAVRRLLDEGIVTHALAVVALGTLLRRDAAG